MADPHVVIYTDGACSGNPGPGGWAALILDPDGERIACGLANYASADVEQIKGLHSQGIATTLGYAYGQEVIHRNNLVVLRTSDE
jgi:glutamate 5-kinase